MQRPTGTGGWMLTFTLRGRALYRDPAGASFYAAAGDLVLLGPDAPAGRGVPRGEEWDAFWLRFEPWPGWAPDGFERVAHQLHRQHIARPGHRQRVHEIWESIVADLDARETVRILEAVNAKLAPLRGPESIENELQLLMLREIFVHAQRDSLIAAQLDPRIRDALDVMERDLAAPLDIRELARRAGLSYSRFAHLFKSQIGASPKRVQVSIRLRRGAVQLEYTDDPVGVIATRMGFSTIFDFSRAFRREYGMSPSVYRSLRR
ncbi:MAG TPA: helix-turn-helix domain-containing protein [Jatrophihabitans sp.]|nr:helix-turn-helix domain-containing protein [Jatrophihabitans sp.]